MTIDWRDPSTYLRHMYVEESCAGDPYVQEIIDRAQLPTQVVNAEAIHALATADYPENLSAGKRTLLLCRNRGDFVKDCPATREYRCCDYRVINVGLGCPMDCVYCILQAYLNTPYLSFFVNIDDLFSELTAKLKAHPNKVMRIGTGEFTDSMALDRITGLSRRLVNFFGGQEKGFLELKTKCGYVDNLKDLDHNGKTIVSWSLNSETMVQQQEFRAASLKQRLDAAANCVDWGYDCGFHFDPLISYPGWEKGYRAIISRLFEKIPAERIAWISLGGFRYLSSLKNIATSRFPNSSIFHHEFIEGLDNKKRYFRPLRVKIYKEVYDAIRSHISSRTCVYFCMESDEIWREVMGFAPSEKGGIPTMLDRAVRLR